jgi:hypothetical protein
VPPTVVTLSLLVRLSMSQKTTGRYVYYKILFYNGILYKSLSNIYIGVLQCVRMLQDVLQVSLHTFSA